MRMPSSALPLQPPHLAHDTLLRHCAPLLEQLLQQVAAGRVLHDNVYLLAVLERADVLAAVGHPVFEVVVAVSLAVRAAPDPKSAAIRSRAAAATCLAIPSPTLQGRSAAGAVQLVPVLPPSFPPCPLPPFPRLLWPHLASVRNRMMRASRRTERFLMALIFDLS
jgi:hypothetical protein